MSSVAEEFPKLIKDCQAIKEIYLALPNHAGAIGALLIQRDLDEAIEALASGDVLQILRSFKKLTDIKESL